MLDGISVAAEVGSRCCISSWWGVGFRWGSDDCHGSKDNNLVAGDDSARSFTVVGTDAAGAALTETVTGANAGTATSVGSFATVTSVTAVGDPAGTVSVGIAGYDNIAGIPTALLSQMWNDDITKYRLDESHDQRRHGGPVLRELSLTVTAPY